VQHGDEDGAIRPFAFGEAIQNGPKWMPGVPRVQLRKLVVRR